jgi:hypothetical protein
MKTVYYVGLDVHKDSIQMAILGTSGKEPLLTKEVARELSGFIWAVMNQAV